jgi:hypothetical protein
LPLPDDPAAKAVTVNTDPEQDQEWLRQNNLIYGGLIGIGVVLASGLVGIGVHSAGYVRLEFKEPGDPEPGAPG